MSFSRTIAMLANTVPRVRMGVASHFSRPLQASRPFVARRQISISAAALNDDRLAGTVKWFNSTKGYGFISPSEGGSDVFVHQTAILADGYRSLAEGESVEYVVFTDNNGRQQAKEVTGPNGAQTVGSTRPRPQERGDRGDRGSYGGGRGGGYRERQSYDYDN